MNTCAVLCSISMRSSIIESVYLHTKYLRPDSLIRCDNIKNIICLDNLRFVLDICDKQCIRILGFDDTIRDYTTVTANKLRVCN